MSEYDPTLRYGLDRSKFSIEFGELILDAYYAAAFSEESNRVRNRFTIVERRWTLPDAEFRLGSEFFLNSRLLIHLDLQPTEKDLMHFTFDPNEDDIYIERIVNEQKAPLPETINRNFQSGLFERLSSKGLVVIEFCRRDMRGKYRFVPVDEGR